MAVTFADQQPGCGPPAPVPILQWEKEFKVLLELYRRLAPADVLEVGTYHGGTLYHWLQNTARPGAKIVTVDSYAVGVDNRHFYDDWNVNDTRLVVIEGDSHAGETVAEIAAHGPFDFVFIDAGHYYDEVRKDWEIYRPMVKPGGMICLHDILTHPAWPSIEVGRLWDEVKGGELSFEIVENRAAEWGGIAVVMVP